MKIFVFAYDRFDTMTTSMFLDNEGIEHIVLCHSVDDRRRFIDAGRVKAENILCTANPKGLAYQRNSALDMMDDGEWAIFLVDDWIKTTELRMYSEYHNAKLSAIPEDIKPDFKRICTMQRFVERCANNARIAQDHGIYLVGYSLTDNDMFRKKHYSLGSLADGRAWVIRKDVMRFDNETQLIDDMCWTAKNIKRYGAVLVDNWLLTLCKRYTDGAFGSIDARMGQKMKEAKYLVETYPDYVAFAEKPGWPSGSHVKLRRTKTRKALTW